MGCRWSRSSRRPFARRRSRELPCKFTIYLVARFEGTGDTPTTASFQGTNRDVRTLERQRFELEAADWRLAAEMKADGRISLADAYAVALAYEREATLVAGADDEFDDLSLDIELRRFHKNGV